MNDGPGVQRLKETLRKFKKREFIPQGLNADLCHRLEIALLHCAPRDLKPLFIDHRIAHWKNTLPDAANAIDRARATIDYLYTHTDRDGENGLILLLDVLRERTNPRDACNRQLDLLKYDIKRGLPYAL